MPQLDDILLFNQEFVRGKSFEPYQTSKYPKKKSIIVTCMDTRLEQLLPRAMNIRNGDVKIVKTAGAIVSHPFGGIMRSIVVAVYQHMVGEIYVIAHHDCGMTQLDFNDTMLKMKHRGISEQSIDILQYAGVDLKRWLSGFEDNRQNVENSVTMIRKHPLIPANIAIHGLIMDPATGQLELIVDGYETLRSTEGESCESGAYV